MPKSKLSGKEKYEKRCLKRDFAHLTKKQAKHFLKTRHRFLDLFKAEVKRIIGEWQDATAGD